MSKPTILTRRELYDLVWTKPMQDLASEFDISDVGLAKICDRHRIPRPGRRYWAKLHAGHRVPKSALPETKDQALDRVEIRSSKSQLPAAALEVIARGRAERLHTPPYPTTQPAPEPFAPLQEVHPAIRPTAKRLRSAKPDTDGGVLAVGDRMCGIYVAPANMERTISFLDALARKLESRELNLEPLGRNMRVGNRPDTATFTVKEQTRREKHIPTAEEFEAEKRQTEGRKRSWGSSIPMNPAVHGRPYPEFDTVYTGALVLQADGYSDGVRRKWADGRRRRVEALLDDIVLGLEALIAVRKARREEWEERERRRQEEVSWSWKIGQGAKVYSTA